MVQPAQFRAARALLGWSQAEAARRARVAVNTIGRIEAGGREVEARTLEAVTRVFEDQGVVFLDDGKMTGVAIGPTRP